ncbi:MAG: hypothetical protein ACHQVS_00685 [Candidatus Babeliales bacterium]
MAKKKSIKAINKEKLSHEECVDEHWCFLEMKMKPMPMRMIVILAEQLIKWVDESDPTKAEGLRISEFLSTHKPKISEHDYYAWIKKWPILDTAHNYALAKIAERREKGALLGYLNPNVVMRFQPIYDREVKKMMEWQASLTKKDDEKSETKIVVIERYPDTGLPSVKKVDDPQKVDENTGDS